MGLSKRYALWLRALLAIVAGFALGRTAPSSTAGEVAVLPPTTGDVPALVAKVRPSVVTVTVHRRGDQRPISATGFFLEQGRVLTNLHVVEGAERCEIRVASGQTFPIKFFLAKDGEGDLALLATEVPADACPPLPLADKAPRQGERVVVVGNPLGLEQSATDGLVSSVREMPDHGTVIQMTAAISPGSSGSPVIDLAGRVVGVARSLVPGGQNVNFATPVERVRALKLGAPQPIERVGDRPGTEEQRRGLIAFVGGSNEDALAHFRRAAQQDPRWAENWVWVGYCLSSLNRHQEAIDPYKEALRLKPDHVVAHYNLAVSCLNAGRSQDAVNAYKEAIRLNPNYAVAYTGLGEAYGKLGQYHDALSAHKEAVRIEPNRALAHCCLGLVYAKLGSYQEAVNAYKEAIRIDPNYAQAHANLGFAYFLLGDRTRALEEYQVLQKLDPSRAKLLFDFLYR